MARYRRSAVIFAGIVLSALLPQCGMSKFDLLGGSGSGGGGGRPQAGNGGKQRGGSNQGGKGNVGEAGDGNERGGSSWGGRRAVGGMPGSGPFGGSSSGGRPSGPTHEPCGTACPRETCFECQQSAPLCAPRPNGIPRVCFTDVDECQDQICVDCLEDDDCGKDDWRCNDVTKTCTLVCSSTTQCQAIFPNNAASCRPENELQERICVQCLQADDCKRDANSRRAVCHPQKYTCVGCMDNGDCDDDLVCDQHYCRE